MNLKMLNDRILVEKLDSESVTAGGLIIPDTAKEKSTKGKVLSVGDGKWNSKTNTRVPMSVKVGDVVVFPKFSGNEFQLEGKTMVAMHEGELIGVINE